MIKKMILCTLLCVVMGNAYSQFGVSAHQSNIPFIGLSYEINDTFLPELRIGMDSYLDDLSLELTASYIYAKNDTVNGYAGIGYRVNVFEGVVIPIGINIYPFEQKHFGCQIELAPILAEDDSILRGSWGIRYRF